MERIAKVGSAVEEQEELTRAQVISETIFLGLRLLEGINVQDLDRQFEEPISKAFASIIEDLKCNGLLEGEDQIRLTSKGVLLSNEVFSRFV